MHPSDAIYIKTREACRKQVDIITRLDCSHDKCARRWGWRKSYRICTFTAGMGINVVEISQDNCEIPTGWTYFYGRMVSEFGCEHF